MNISFDIIYRLKGNQDKNSIVGISKFELDNHLKQLKKMVSSFSGDLVFGIKDLDYLKINKKNYSYEKDGECYIWVESVDTKTQKPGFTDISLGDFFIKKEEDVTNEVLFEFGICGDDYYKKGKVLFENNVICADSFEFKLEEESKVSDLFNLLFIAKAFYKRLYFTYDELKFINKNGGYKCKKLVSFDIRDGGIRDIMGKKLTNIKEKTGMKDKILEIEPKVIAIRQEKAYK